VPLFHCNAWVQPWLVPMMGGTLVCCRDVTAKAIYDAIADEGVTHFGGAPIVLNTIINAKDADRRAFDHVVEVFTAGAPPPAATLAAIEPLGFNVTQVYGLTETYGPATECLWQPEWDDKTGEDRAAFKARTWVPMAMLEAAEVHDTHGVPVPRDSAHLGEIAMRGNMVMKGYYKNPQATAEAFKGGWFRSGDIALQHPDGYIKITDRAKDIIISGGENVSSVEVEGALMHHPAVSLCAVVAKPDAKWAEVPCAFVELKSGAEVTEEELIKFCRARLAGFATPKAVVFCELPKTSTGKIQKFELRAVAKLMAQQQGVTA
jgi:fatty-acyl-CoA synthase